MIDDSDRLTSEDVRHILCVPHFRNAREASQDIGALYLSYATNFANLIPAYNLQPEPAVIADVGTGYGWLAIALARRSNARIIAIDNDPARMRAARQIARILDVDHCIDWRLGGLPHLPMDDHEADVTFCVEVIEHVSIQPAVVRELGRVTKDMLVITTPNRLFPWINHDTGLPFCHWLPQSLRNAYAYAFGRLHMQDNNQFWSARMLLAALPDFRRVSNLLQFPDVRQFLDSERETAKGSGQTASRHRLLRRYLFLAAARLGPYAIQALPSLASTFRRSGSGMASLSSPVQS